MSHHYRDSHNKDKTISRPFYLYHGNTHTWKDRFHTKTGPRYFINDASALAHRLVLSLTVVWCLNKVHLIDQGNMFSCLSIFNRVYSRHVSLSSSILSLHINWQIIESNCIKTCGCVILPWFDNGLSNWYWWWLSILIKVHSHAMFR